MPFSKPSFIPIKLLVALGMVLSSFGIAVRPAYAAACQAGTPGCVLPVSAAPLSVAPEAPPPPAPIVDDYDDGKSIGWLPILLGLLAAGALAYFLFIDDDDDDPESP